MREKYVDTLAKLYDYATTVYSKKQSTPGFDTKKVATPTILSRQSATVFQRS